MRTPTASSSSRWLVPAATASVRSNTSKDLYAEDRRHSSNGTNRTKREAVDMKGRSTELIHAGESDLGEAVPLTTPIYETSTFVFDSAQEVVAHNEGRSSK